MNQTESEDHRLSDASLNSIHSYLLPVLAREVTRLHAVLAKSTIAVARKAK